MKTFHCTHCQNLVFFENVRCLNCKYPLAYLPDQGLMAALVQSPDGLWRSDNQVPADRGYRLCQNYDQASVCNWAVGADDPNTLCASCRLNRVIPDLSTPRNTTAWFRLELAKRRMLYTLLGLGLPVAAKSEENESGLAFEFLEDSTDGDAKRVLTGHDNGLITLNIAEADDVKRETQRTLQNEQYRTLLGHFRHEIGHYFWDVLIQELAPLEPFRARFGDERADYQEALKKHYAEGPPAHWERDFVSAYATTHPWEDWAESWAHYLHMVDALETAGATGLMLKPTRADEPSMQPPADPLNANGQDFDRMVESWLSLTYVLNNLSRGLGLPDTYPFVLSKPAIEKLRFIHDIINRSRVPNPIGATEKDDTADTVRAPAPAVAESRVNM
jgi:hypothetical protein